MNFNDDDSILYLDDSSFRPSPFSNFQSPNPNTAPGFPGSQPQGSNPNMIPGSPGGPSQGSNPNMTPGFPGGSSQGSNPSMIPGSPGAPSPGSNPNMIPGFPGGPSSGGNPNPAPGFTGGPSSGGNPNPAPGFPGGPTQGINPNLIPGFPGVPSQGFPGGPPQGSSLNIGPPPNFTPSKNAPGVQSFGGPQAKAVSPGSISMCLFRFTYIWERGGRNYWAYLLNVDRRSVSGLRWFRNNWVFFGVGLNRIDSFICYRSDSNVCQSTRKESLIQTKKEFNDYEIKHVYTRVLDSVEIPEERNDFLINYLGEVEGNDLTVKVPCKQRRTVSYRIALEIKYPESFNGDTIEEINSFAIEASDEAVKYLDDFRGSKKFLTPFEVFNNRAKNIGKVVKVFSDEFTTKVKKLRLPRETTKHIEYTITQEKVEEPWRIV